MAFFKNVIQSLTYMRKTLKSLQTKFERLYMKNGPDQVYIIEMGPTPQINSGSENTHKFF